MKRICVYCGSRPGRSEALRDAARGLAAALAARGIGLVYGGGHVGLMGLIADEVKARGGHVIGVIPEDMVVREWAHRGLDELRIVRDMHERKATMAALADGFIAMPGGFGTFEELLEMITWRQLGYHAKPIGILDADGFYAPLLGMFRAATAMGFIDEGHDGLYTAAADGESLLGRMGF